MYGKPEKQAFQQFCGRHCILLVRHSFSYSETSGLSSHVMVVNVERHMLLRLQY